IARRHARSRLEVVRQPAGQPLPARTLVLTAEEVRVRTLGSAPAGWWDLGSRCEEDVGPGRVHDDLRHVGAVEPLAPVAEGDAAVLAAVDAVAGGRNDDLRVVRHRDDVM